MNRRRQEQLIQWTWAGIILALFVGRQIWRHTHPSKEPAWVQWELVEMTDKRSSTKRQPKPNYVSTPKSSSQKQHSTYSSRSVRSIITVGSDTVSEDWLLLNTTWPDWKVAQFIRTRNNWGGMDSSIMNYDWTAHHITWSHHPIPQRNINTMSRNELGQHPLIGWDRAKMLHQYRSRVRPFQSWDEVWALGIADSTARITWPQRFLLN